eukprot:COSAG02_NODE_502_length_21039_cov_62.499045_3_plen_143_part_00
MLSYQWSYQAVTQRLNISLQGRGYLTWFDLTNMKGALYGWFGASGGFCAKPGACMTRIAGSTMDAMSDAIEGADVMLYGVSLQYKESANCRLEASCLCACRVVCIQPQRLTSSCSAGQLRPSTGAGHDPIDGAEGLLAEGMA